MRNTILTGEELPTTYTYSGSTFQLRHEDDDEAFFNNAAGSHILGTNFSDFSTAGLQYWLNDTTSGYLSTISSTAQRKIDSSYTYYLGKHIANEDTTVTAYTNERDVSNIYSGSPATWSGAVAFLYPSDYGYSAKSSYWSETTLYNYGSNYDNTGTDAYLTSWMQQNAGHKRTEWFLAPSSNGSNGVALWYRYGYVDYFTASYYFAARPCINLLSTVDINVIIETDKNVKVKS